MRVIRNEELQTWTFVPIGTEEIQAIEAISAMLKSEDRLSYGGRGQDGDGFCTVHLHAGAERKRETTDNVTRTVYVGGTKLVLCGSSEEDKREVGCIRDTCYYGSGGLIFLGEAEVDGKKSIITTAKRCKHCKMGMLLYSRCEWNTCEACVAKCEHEYDRGGIHGGEINIGVGEFCIKCGRGRPKAEGERKKSLAEHHIEAVMELRVTIITRPM